MNRCDVCSKGILIGKDSTHKASGRWMMRAPDSKKVWKPNLHVVRVKVGGQMKRLRLCTKCLRQTKVVSESRPTKASQVSSSGVGSLPKTA